MKEGMCAAVAWHDMPLPRHSRLDANTTARCYFPGFRLTHVRITRLIQLPAASRKLTLTAICGSPERRGNLTGQLNSVESNS
ncbi:hypothetical protein GJ744_005358 [Endocarpon pusillum]|uniref:Uncharacterized protein n=1 Tax=Endocarpon pusillum TaxID=364733 RepID=A0A8H7ANA2_9EURO|nr:hypothetical protein GJ744_005358 [Endocarpon pusillum]